MQDLGSNKGLAGNEKGKLSSLAIRYYKITACYMSDSVILLK
jgi:hypothetical protein